MRRIRWMTLCRTRNIDRVLLSNPIQPADAKPAGKLSPPAGPHAAESLGETLKEKRHSS